MRLATKSATFEIDSYIRKITTKDGHVILNDDGVGQHVNDPRVGGAGVFGVCIGKKNSHWPGDPWNCTWDITGRMPLKDGYGVKPIADNVLGYFADGVQFARVTYAYQAKDTKLVQTVTVALTEPLYTKEPKVVVNNLRGYRYVKVLRTGTPDSADMDRYPDPRRKTFQVGDARPSGLVLTGDSPALTIRCDGGLRKWARDVADAEPFVQTGEAYCLKDGELLEQWEVTRFKDDGRMGVFLHGFEGGAGQISCLHCYRFTAPATYKTTISYEVA